MHVIYSLFIMCIGLAPRFVGFASLPRTFLAMKTLSVMALRKSSLAIQPWSMLMFCWFLDSAEQNPCVLSLLPYNMYVLEGINIWIMDCFLQTGKFSNAFSGLDINAVHCKKLLSFGRRKNDLCLHSFAELLVL